MLKHTLCTLLLLMSFGFVKAQNEREEKIEEVTINAAKTHFKNKKENPAYQIMQEVWKRKKNNGLEKFSTYTYKEYEKIEFDAANIDSTLMKRKIFRGMDFIFDYSDSADNGKLQLPIFLNEFITILVKTNRSKSKNVNFLLKKRRDFKTTKSLHLQRKTCIAILICTIILSTISI